MAKPTIMLFVILFYCYTAAACVSLRGESVPFVNFPNKYKENRADKGYAFSLLRLALQKTERDFGPCEARLVMESLPINRVEMYLEAGDVLQAVDLSIRKDRSARFLVVPIPLYKGLAGNRIFLVRKGESHLYKGVQELASLKSFTAGQGESWADTDILRANGLKVKTTENIDSLVDMLIHNRFDYFPRGAAEVFSELNLYGDSPVEVEPSLLIIYPFMTAFHVSKNQPGLVVRLKVGLDRAIDDGSFDKHFYSHPTITPVLSTYNISERRSIVLCNPNIPKWVPLHSDRYWLSPWPATIKSRAACGQAVDNVAHSGSM